MLFLGALMLLLCVFLLGVLWPHARNHSLGVAFWGYFVKALFISWFWFYASFHSDLGNAAPALAIILTIIALLVIGNGYVSFYAPARDAFISTRIRNITFIIITLVMSLPALKSFGAIFSEWDAVVSWNRWAIELASNQYNPQSAAYPILWPAVWSNIYEAQGTTAIWYLTKASIAAPLIFISIYAANKIRYNGFFSGITLCLLIYGFLFTQSQYVVSGYMDTPVAILGLGSLLILDDVLSEGEKDRQRDLLTLAALTISVALITKQSGAMFAIYFLIFAIIQLLNNTINFRRFMVLMTIALIPVATYLQVYFVRQDSIIGNIDHLNAIAAQARGETNVFVYAFKLLFDAAPAPAFVLLSLGLVLNVLFWKKVRARFGLILIALGVVSYMVFADCCSYKVRNGYFVYAFFIASAYIGFSELEAHLRKPGAAGAAATVASNWQIAPKNSIAALASILIALLAVSMSYPTEELLKRHRETQSKVVGSGNVNQFLLMHERTISEHDKIASYYQPMKFIPHTERKYVYCPTTSPQCIAKLFADGNINSVVVFSAHWNENEASREFLSSSLENQSAKVVGKLNNFELISFERSKWERAQSGSDST